VIVARPESRVGEGKKAVIESENIYNHNFTGHYCECNRIYDEKDEIQQELTMIQCYLCEDWYHEKCISGIPADIEDYICRTCTDRYSFLRYYGQQNKCGWSKKTPLSIEVTMCYLEELKMTYPREAQEDEQQQLFMKPGWKEYLCTCESCRKMYHEHHVEFLYEGEKEFELPSDSEEEVSLYEAGMKVLETLDRNIALQGAWAIQELGAKLKAYLAPFAQEQRTVTKEDIDRFFYEQFMELEQKKKYATTENMH
jgi:E3 ubiquitin-protein ligase UBR7